jgi:hypothetical protein
MCVPIDYYILVQQLCRSQLPATLSRRLTIITLRHMPLLLQLPIFQHSKSMRMTNLEDMIYISKCLGAGMHSGDMIGTAMQTEVDMRSEGRICFSKKSLADMRADHAWRAVDLVRTRWHSPLLMWICPRTWICLPMWSLLDFQATFWNLVSPYPARVSPGWTRLILIDLFYASSDSRAHCRGLWVA